MTWNDPYGYGRLDVHKAIAQGATDSFLTGRTGAGPNGAVKAVGIQSGRSSDAVLAGSFTTVDGVSHQYIARLYGSAGGLDPSFTTALEGAANCIAIQSDNKILVGMSAVPYIKRLNSDGTVDTGFTAAYFNGAVQAFSLRGDGKIWVVGDFTSANLIQAYHIILLNASGSSDTSFSPFYGVNGPAYAVAAQSDGKVLVGGNFSGAGAGATRYNLARLATGGDNDSTFSPGSGPNLPVYAIVVQADGKVLIGGDFTAYNGTGRNRIARVLSGGGLDTTFNPGTGAGATVRAITLQSDGKVWLGGSFITFNGATVNRCTRINADGSSDLYFDVGTGANNTLNSIALMSDGRAFLGGDFTTFNGAANVRLTRVHGN